MEQIKGEKKRKTKRKATLADLDENNLLNNTTNYDNTTLFDSMSHHPYFQMQGLISPMTMPFTPTFKTLPNTPKFSNNNGSPNIKSNHITNKNDNNVNLGGLIGFNMPLTPTVNVPIPMGMNLGMNIPYSIPMSMYTNDINHDNNGLDYTSNLVNSMMGNNNKNINQKRRKVESYKFIFLCFL